MIKTPPATRFYTLTTNPLRMRSVWLTILVSVAVVCMQIRKSVLPLFLFLLLSYVCYKYDQYFFESLKIELKLARWIFVGKHHDQETSYSIKVQYTMTDEKIIIKGHLDGLDERELSDMTDETNQRLFQSLMQRQLEGFEVSDDYSYVQFEFFRENDKALRVSRTIQHNPTNTIQLTERRVWNIDDSPHGLISGGTGSGKSYLLLYLLHQFELMNAETIVIDPKMSDLMEYRQYLKHGVKGESTEEILVTLRQVHQELIVRQKRKLETGQIERPFFLLFDEYPAFLASLDRKEKAEVEQILKQIILKGRALRVFVIIAMQRADASILAAEVRDQFGLRIALSRTSADGLTMIFGEQAKQLVEMSEARKGYVKTNDMSIPTRFQTALFDVTVKEVFDQVFNK